MMTRTAARAALLIVAILSLTALVLRLAGSGARSSQPGAQASSSLPELVGAALPAHGKLPVALRQPGFREMSAAAGIAFQMQFLPAEQGENFKVNLYDHGCGVAVGDIDGDGRDDVYFCNQLGANALYRNRGDGTFEDVTRSSGPVGLDDRISVGATFADYDNDGDQDLYVTSTRGGNALLQNDGRGEFCDVTARSGLTLVAHSQTGAFFDYDQDGDLDLLVTNTAAWTGEFNPVDRYYSGPGDLYALAGSAIEHNVFYRNDGDGTFSDVTAYVGLAGVGWAGDLAIFDYDEDGRLDVLVTNMFGQSQLYRNQDDGTFVDVTRESLSRGSWGAIGAAAFDVNNDGHLDLYIVDMHSDMWVPREQDQAQIVESKKYPFAQGALMEASPQAARELEQKFADMFQIDYRHVQFGNTLFRNLGQGAFEEVSDKLGVETFWPWGIAAGDFDCNGRQDVFLPSGMGYPYFYWRNYLLMNSGRDGFRDESRTRGIEPRPGGDCLDAQIGGVPAMRSSRCAATSDFDGDGRLDLVVNNFNNVAYYYRNEFPRKRYVKFHLRGTRSNRDAIGATVRLYVGDEVLVRQVNPAGGYLSQSSKTLHFGLADYDRIDRAEIRWPNGSRQVLDSPALDTLHEVTEGG